MRETALHRLESGRISLIKVLYIFFIFEYQILTNLNQSLMSQIIIFIVAFIVFIAVIRLFGAWMLRINEVITLLKEISAKLNSGKE